MTELNNQTIAGSGDQGDVGQKCMALRMIGMDGNRSDGTVTSLSQKVWTTTTRSRGP